MTGITKAQTIEAIQATMTEKDRNTLNKTIIQLLGKRHQEMTEVIESTAEHLRVLMRCLQEKTVASGMDDVSATEEEIREAVTKLQKQQDKILVMKEEIISDVASSLKSEPDTPDNFVIKEVIKIIFLEHSNDPQIKKLRHSSPFLISQEPRPN